MRIPIVAMLAIALLGSSAWAQQDQDSGLGPAIPGLGGVPTLGTLGSSDPPAWMPKPLPDTPPQRPPLTAADAIQELRDLGYYDIKPLHESPTGFSTQAWRYGRQVTVNISKRDGFVSQPGGND